MTNSLRMIRRRVEAMGRELLACAEPHTLFRLVGVGPDGTPPTWPESERKACCACGRAMKYIQIVNACYTGAGRVFPLAARQ